MKMLLKILKILLVLLVLVVAGVVAAVLIIDPDDYRDRVVARIEAATGRQAAITGALDVSLGFRPRLAVDGLQLGNAAWSAHAGMLALDTISASAPLLPLFGRRLDLTLHVQGLRLRLERDADGRANWVFTPADPEHDGPDGREAAEQPRQTGQRPELPVQVNLVDIVIDNVEIVYDDAMTGRETVAAIDSLRANDAGNDGQVRLALAGQIDGSPFGASGQMGQPVAALGGDAPFPLDIQAEALGLKLALAGAIADLARASGLDLRLDLSADTLEGLRPLAGDRVPAGGPLEVKAHIQGDPASLALNDLLLAFADTGLTGNLKATTGGDRPRVTGTLQASRIDLPALTGATPNQETPDQEAPDQAAPEEAAGTGPADTGTAGSGQGDGRVLPDTPLPLAGLRAVDADLGIQVAELVTPRLTVRDISLGIRLENGLLTMDPLSADPAGGKLSGSLTLDATTDSAGLDVALKAPAFQPGALVREMTGEDVIRGAAALDIDLKSRGASVAALAAGLTGHGRLVMEEGQARTESFDLIIGGLTAAASTLFQGQQEFTVVNCMAINLDFDRGAGKTLALLDTELFSLTGEGTVNLADETLGIKVTPRASTPTLNLALPINIGGTFARPAFAPDAGATLSTLGGLVGATLFPPAALLALGDLGGSSGDSCVSGAAQPGAGPAPQPGNPGAQPGPADGAEQGNAVPNPVGEAVEGLRNLFDR